MTQSFRLARLTLARAARQPALIQRRTFVTPTAALRADLVQDLYLKELKAYKPTPVKASDAEGQVQTFSAPKVPQLPEEGDIARDLKAYEEQKVEVEGQAAEGEEVDWEKEWFESLEKVEGEDAPSH